MERASRLVTLSIAALLTDCATADFTPYVGAQQTGLQQAGHSSAIAPRVKPLSEKINVRLVAYSRLLHGLAHIV